MSIYYKAGVLSLLSFLLTQNVDASSIVIIESETGIDAVILADDVDVSTDDRWPGVLKFAGKSAMKAYEDALSQSSVFADDINSVDVGESTYRFSCECRFEISTNDNWSIIRVLDEKDRMKKSPGVDSSKEGENLAAENLARQVSDIRSAFKAKQVNASTDNEIVSPPQVTPSFNIQAREAQVSTGAELDGSPKIANYTSNSHSRRDALAQLGQEFSFAATAGAVDIDSGQRSMGGDGAQILVASTDIGASELRHLEFVGIGASQITPETAVDDLCKSSEYSEFLLGESANGSRGAIDTSSDGFPPENSLTELSFYSEAERYLRLGFGAEAIELLNSSEPSDRRGQVLRAIATIIDGVPERGLALQAELTECESPISMWALLSNAGLADASSVQRDAILLSFSRLPWHLRGLLGDDLASIFSELGDLPAADLVRSSTRRSSRHAHEVGESLNLAREEAADPGGLGPTAPKIDVTALIGGTALLKREKTNEGLNNSIETGAEAVESRGTDASEGLFVETIKALAFQGNYLDAVDELYRVHSLGDVSIRTKRLIENEVVMSSVRNSSIAELTLLVSKIEESGGWEDVVESTKRAARARLSALTGPQEANVGNASVKDSSDLSRRDRPKNSFPGVVSSQFDDASAGSTGDVREALADSLVDLDLHTQGNAVFSLGGMGDVAEILERSNSLIRNLD